MKKYPKHYAPESGEWVPHNSKMEWQCCDCGLVHNVWFRISKDGMLEVKMTINAKKTKKTRQLKADS
jgi:hypothetical protein